MKSTYREKSIECREGDSFLIGDAIEVFVESTRKGSVRLRCWTPGSLQVAPKAAIESVAAENRKAALSRIPAMEDLYIALDEE